MSDTKAPNDTDMRPDVKWDLFDLDRATLDDLDRATLDRIKEYKWGPGDWLKDLKLDARTAYQVACTLYMQENTVTWNRFNAMVAANSFIVAASGFATTAAAGGSTPLKPLAVALPLAGCVLCVTWLLIMLRGFAYHDLWRDSALRLEQIFFPRANALRNAAELREKSKPGRPEAADPKEKSKTDHYKAPRGQARYYAPVLFTKRRR